MFITNDRRKINDVISVVLILVFAFLLFWASKNRTIYEVDPPLSAEPLFTTKWDYPTSTSTSATYTEFATRVNNVGQITYLEIYYVLSDDSTLTAHILDENLNIVISSDSIFTEAGSGTQGFTIPDYSYTEDNMYIALESDAQTLGLGTVQDVQAVSSCVTADNRVSGIQNAQRWSPSSALSKVKGSTQYGISLYIEAYGEAFPEEEDEPVEEDITLFKTKWADPSSTATNATYAGFATRVMNQGHINSVDIYYVLTEDCNLRAGILDTDLNKVVESSSVNTKAGVGYQHFVIPDYDYEYTEMYISLEADKKALGVGTIQDISAVSSCVTSDNTVTGKQNASKSSPDKELTKVNGSTKNGLSLYIVAYGYETTESLIEPDTEEIVEEEVVDESPRLKTLTKKTIARSVPRRAVYISTSGSDKTTSGSQSSPYKSLSYAIKQNGSNTAYYLRCGDTFTVRYGVVIANLNNVYISSYETGPQPVISGLISFAPSKSNGKVVGTLSEKNLGVLVLDGEDYWKRKTLNNDISDPNSYYLDTESKKVTVNTNASISSGGFAAPYCGMIIRGCNHLTVSDIELCYYGLHGMQVTSNSSDISINNCTVHHIGGATTDGVKLGNGIELWLTNLTDIYVENNYVYDCFDAGITGQISDNGTYTNKNIVFEGNLVINCRYNFEYFNSNSAATTCQMEVVNNELINSIDITEGYRERAGTAYGAFFCLWKSNGTKDSIVIEDNICEYSDASCVSFKESSNGKISLYNNSFSSYKQQVLNPKYLFGSGNNF
ncbi:right-handed parallel beta-helix repeat-containing protein [Pseudobutyrivibrio xylanivorans]|uniref:Right-handed parallel beta-helix repeat-containing protein n=1 Tax=Pseudobutyrivibrio xylanivorans TaxID=185007 RepID=A0A1G5RZZ3_PSEXY|nr:right-handed parallel beta-helix repeat-containing protein [Pseudobutyrivibrio xylanivorans]SCZ79694.1 hypothetical protein SAMN02910350_01902 [Pseudobutyrivibrio xylanivorans]